MLWVDKHRPITFDKMDFHAELNERLKSLAESDDFPHLLFYGPSGAGKKTRIMALLRELYGPGVEKMKVEHRTFKLPSGTAIELTTLASLYHIEMNPSDAGYYDRAVVQEVIKEIAASPPIETKKQKSFKVVILNEVDRLTREAQQALRRTMEKYMAVCRLILCCTSTSKVIDPLRSRCLSVRVPAPTEDEIAGVLTKICKREGLVLPAGLAAKISRESDRNVRRAILMLEATKVRQYPFDESQPIEHADWETFIVQLSNSIIQEQSPARLLEVRGKLYELLSHCIPPELILRRLALELLKKSDMEVKYEITRWAAYYEHHMQLGSKSIFHLEAFVAKFMSIYKRFLVNTFGM